MKISREGVLLIKSFEGFRPRAVLRPDGRWVVGYGHTASAREGTRVSEADAELLLQYDLIPVRAALIDSLNRSVNQHQFDALASFAFSVGTEAFRTSEVLAQVNAGAVSDAAEAMAAWPELVVRDAGLHRRAAERALFVASPGVAVTLADLLCAPLPETPNPAISRSTIEAANDLLPDPTLVPGAVGGAHAGSEPTGQDPRGSEPIGSRPTDPNVPPVTTLPAQEQGEAKEQTLARGEATSVPVTEPEIADDSVGADTRTETATSPSQTADLRPISLPVEGQPEASVAGEAQAPDPVTAALVDNTVDGSVQSEGLVPDTSTQAPQTASGPAQSPAAVTSFAGPAALGSSGETAPVYTGTGTGELPSDPGQSKPMDANPAFMADPFTGAVSGPGEHRPAPIMWPAQTDQQAATGQLQVNRAVAEGSALSSPRLVWPGEAKQASDQAPVASTAGGAADGRDGDGVPTTRAWTDPLEVQPTRFSWRRVWGFLLMGSFGLVSLAMAMAALRKASLATSDIQSILAIAAVLATIGTACVGVSAFNIYQRLSEDR